VVAVVSDVVFVVVVSIVVEVVVVGSTIGAGSVVVVCGGVYG